MTRISECVWEEHRRGRSTVKYEFVDFNQINGLFLFDKVKKIFININDKDYSVGKSIDNLITITNGEWTNFNQFGLTSFGLVFKNTDKCEFVMNRRGIINPIFHQSILIY